MKTLDLMNKKINIRASNMALLYYQQEFESNIIQDLQKFESNKNEDGTVIPDPILLMQFIWAMHKAAKKGKLQDFETWVDTVQIDFGDDKLWEAVLFTMIDGFFPKAANTSKKKVKYQTNNKKR